MPAAMLKIHPARDAQLAALAAKRGTTKTAALDFLINLAIEHGEMPDRLPGYEAWAEGPAVMVAVDGAELPAMTARSARSLGELVTRFAMSGGNSGVSLSLHTGGQLNVARYGGGIVLRLTDAAGNVGAPATLTPTMALDFARALNSASYAAD